jgi:hypothetical protein
MAEGVASRRRSRLPLAVAVVVLCAHALGTALSGLRFGPPFVLAVSSALAAGLWAVARVGRGGPLPSGVRWALLAVWLVPPLLLWLAVGWAPLFPPPRDPIMSEPSPWCRQETEPGSVLSSGDS